MKKGDSGARPLPPSLALGAEGQAQARSEAEVVAASVVQASN